MKKYILLFSITQVISGAILAQSAKSVFAELGGAGVASLNYDMRFTKSNGGIGGRAGIGYLTIKDSYGSGYDRTSIFTFPLEVNYLLGKDDKHFFEIGAGGTIVTSKYKSTDPYDDNENFSTSFGHIYLGYRLQPKEGGFIFRAGICPVFGSGFFIPYYAGVSFGYKF